MQLNISYDKTVGNQIQPLISILSQFRKDVFSLPPYSYCFDVNAEEEYLQEYISNKHACLICAKHNDEVIGVISGMPLGSNSNINKGSQVIFEKNSLKAGKFFYICEVIVLLPYRHQGVGERLIQRIESHARSLGIENSCLLTLTNKKTNSSRKTLWEKTGYMLTSMTEYYEWPTYIDHKAVIKTKHELVYWIKSYENIHDRLASLL